jgi:RHS repeat-associated protein
LHLERVKSRYTGKERDAESGNDYFGARYYASSMGRFLSPDDGSDQDTDDPQSLNLYVYVRNNPLIYTDPDGHGCQKTQFSHQDDDGKTVDDGTFFDYSTCPGSVLSDLLLQRGQPRPASANRNGIAPNSSGNAQSKNCFSPNALQKKGIALQQKVAQFFGHPFGLGAGISGGVGLGKGFGFAGSASAQMIVNPDGNAFLVYTYGGSGLTTPWLSLQSKGAGVVGGFQGSLRTATNATLSDLQGYAVDGSAGGGDGLGLAGDVSYSGQSQGTLTVGGAAGGWGQAGVITNAVAIPSCSNHP